MKNSPVQTGFTLLELMLALTLFSFVVALGYQSMTRLATNQRSLQQHSQSQYSKGLAHQTLRTALGSGARIVGNKTYLTLDFTDSDSLYFPQESKQSFSLSNGVLISQFANSNESIELIRNLDSAEFTYIHAGNRHSDWPKSTAPQIIELSWHENGLTQSWLFSKR